MVKKVDLKEIFKQLQSEMINRYSTASKIMAHPGSKGDLSEFNWKEMFQNYLPKRYQVEKAFVLDHKGNVSDQIDIVIFDRIYSPFLFYHGGVCYIPAESVYAIFEVKPSINAGNLKYAGKKTLSVRKLKRTTKEIPYADGEYPPKKPFNILSGFLCVNSDWKTDTKRYIEKTLETLNLNCQIDIICVLNEGSFEIIYSKDDVKIKHQPKRKSLIIFFMTLLEKLQQLGTVVAIDIDQYKRSL